MVWYMERLPQDEREEWFASLGRPLDVNSPSAVRDEEFDDSYDQIKKDQ